MKRYLLTAGLFFAMAIIAAHFFAPRGYRIANKTISDLASQGHSQKWIMQGGFTGFGILVAAGIAWKYLAILIYGLSILITGIFCTIPNQVGTAYSVKESQLHSLFAFGAGLALIAGILIVILQTAENRWIHVGFLLGISLISLAFGLAESGILVIGTGLIQLALYLVSFIWLVLYYI